MLKKNTKPSDRVAKSLAPHNLDHVRGGSNIREGGHTVGGFGTIGR